MTCHCQEILIISDFSFGPSKKTNDRRHHHLFFSKLFVAFNSNNMELLSTN